MAKKITGYIKLQVPAGTANPAPPIGPALGQRGVNIMGIAMQVAAGDYLEAQARARQFLESRPQSRLAPFALAFTTIYALPELPPGEKPGAVVSARKAAHLAQQRLPDFGDVYIAECKLYPVAYAACEKLARETLRKDPSAPTMRSQLALLLMPRSSPTVEAVAELWKRIEKALAK